jgi:hypothetical protein
MGESLASNESLGRLEAAMPEQPDKAGKRGFDLGGLGELVLKWLPAIIVLATVLINYGKDTSQIESLKTQIEIQKTTIQGLVDKVSTMSDKLSNQEGKLDTFMRAQEEQRRYDESTARH